MSADIIPWLFGFTFLAVLVYGLLQWRSAQQAKAHHERSAMPPPDPVSVAKAHGQRTPARQDAPGDR